MKFTKEQKTYLQELLTINMKGSHEFWDKYDKGEIDPDPSTIEEEGLISDTFNIVENMLNGLDEENEVISIKWSGNDLRCKNIHDKVNELQHGQWTNYIDDEGNEIVDESLNPVEVKAFFTGLKITDDGIHSCLDEIERHHDCEYGITWNTIESKVEDWKEDQQYIEIEFMYADGHNYKTFFTMQLPQSQIDILTLNSCDEITMGEHGTPTQDEFFESTIHRKSYNNTYDHDILHIQSIIKFPNN